MAYGGVMPLYAVLARDYFSQSIMGTVLGGITMLSSLGMALGPLGGGWIYDTFGNYAWLYVGSAALAARRRRHRPRLPAGPRRRRPRSRRRPDRGRTGGAVMSNPDCLLSICVVHTSCMRCAWCRCGVAYSSPSFFLFFFLLSLYLFFLFSLFLLLSFFFYFLFLYLPLALFRFEIFFVREQVDRPDSSFLPLQPRETLSRPDSCRHCRDICLSPLSAFSRSSLAESSTLVSVVHLSFSTISLGLSPCIARLPGSSARGHFRA